MCWQVGKVAQIQTLYQQFTTDESDLCLWDIHGLQSVADCGLES